ncbi:MAG: nitrate- and nitrite sensing domain-containing protein, partial [Thauera propionica]|nr:nitrate- and nitrite sensing domain-containing protein [Thauera propionica]
MKTLFLPAVRLLDRLNYPLKFSLILLVCGLSAAALLAQIFVSLREDMTVAEREIAGLTLFDAGFAVVLLTQQHRGLNAGVLGGSTELIPKRDAVARELEGAVARLETSMATDSAWVPLQGAWSPVRSELQRLVSSAPTMPAPESFKAHSVAIASLLRWIGDLGEVSGLSRDPDPATSNLIGPLLTSLPQLSEGLGQIRGRGTNIIARREVLRGDEHAMVALLADIARTEATLLESLERAGKANTAIGGALERSRTEIAAAVASVRQAATRDILEQQFTLAPPAYFELGTQAISTTVRNFDEVLRPQTGQLLQQRLDELSERLRFQIVLSAVAMLVAGYLFTAVYLAIVRSVRELSAGAKRYAAGDYRTRVDFSA